MKIVKIRGKNGEGFSIFPDTVRSMIDPGKENSLLGDISTGINNSVLYRRFPGYSWPIWVSSAENSLSGSAVPYSNPVLLNTRCRNWQILTNYLSDGELKIDSSGMITGPEGSGWSVEFWIYSKNIFHRPGGFLSSITASRNASTGELEISGDYKGISFIQKITGGKSNIDEAVISYTASSRSDMTGSMLIAALRPYNTTMLGGLRSAEYVGGSSLVRLNGKAHFVSACSADRVVTGSGIMGDITPELFDNADSFAVECPAYMAAICLGFNLSGTSCSNIFRIALDPEKELSSAFNRKYEDSAKDFSVLNGIRISEGITVEIPHEKYMNVLNQARLTMLNINSSDYTPFGAEKAADSFFYVYGMTRAGQLRDAENIVRQMSGGIAFNSKKPDFSTSINAAYIIASFNELYLHKRDSNYLQENFPEIRRIGDYVYSFCSNIHNTTALKSNTEKYNIISESSERDIFVFYLAMSGMAYLSRCMGIFGHESRFRNEAERLQAIVRDSYEKKRSVSVLCPHDFSGLTAFPERLYLSPGEEEYNKLFRNLFISDNFPIFDRMYGIDMFAGFSVLNQMLAIRDGRFYEFLDKLLGYTDTFFTLPEYVNPVTGKGSWGNGNSKVIASLLFVIMRNMFFIESADRLELFPVPDERFFVSGSRIKIENAPSRFGILSFVAETAEKEVKITFTGLPKYVPADIRINLPFETKILEGDDFILKKKVNNSYFINGWPSVVRFHVAGKTATV